MEEGGGKGCLLLSSPPPFLTREICVLLSQPGGATATAQRLGTRFNDVGACLVRPAVKKGCGIGGSFSAGRGGQILVSYPVRAQEGSVVVAGLPRCAVDTDPAIGGRGDL